MNAEGIRHVEIAKRHLDDSVGEETVATSTVSPSGADLEGSGVFLKNFIGAVKRCNKRGNSVVRKSKKKKKT